MRIDEKTRNVHFQWEKDSSRSYSYTPSLIRTLCGKPLTLYLMYYLICPRNLNIIEYSKPTTFFIFRVTPRTNLVGTALNKHKLTIKRGGVHSASSKYSTMWKSFLKTNKR